jgi:hypothetical protein
MIQDKFGLNWPSGFRGEDFLKSLDGRLLSLNCKHVQHVKIYIPCNSEVNLITHLGVIALFSSPVWAIAITWRSSLCLYSSNLGTFWLKIKQFWPFEEISIFSNDGHLGWRAWELSLT